MKGNIFSQEDKEFMEIVQTDLQRYLQQNIFPSRTVLVFPPFNGFRRFLIHKLIEDNFASSEVAAFSIGQDISRRIVVCYKGLVSEAAKKGLPATIPQPHKQNMIDKEKSSRQKQTPTAAVYRPPAARQAENRRSRDNLNSADTKQARVRRPDQQMYVPRPKRASYGNEIPRSRSGSNSRLSLESDQSLELKNNPSVNSEELRIHEQNEASNDCHDSILTGCSIEGNSYITTEISSNLYCAKIQPSNEINLTNKSISDSVEKTATEKEICLSEKCEETSKQESDEIKDIVKNEGQEIATKLSENAESKIIKNDEIQVDSQDNEPFINSEGQLEENTSSSFQPKKVIDNEEESFELMETISISSESKSEESNSSLVSSNGSKTSDSSSDYKDEKKCKHKTTEKMDTDYFEEKHSGNRTKNRVHLKEEETGTKLETSSNEVSEVLVISDTNSSDDSMKSKIVERQKNKSSEKLRSQMSSKEKDKKVKNVAKQSKVIDPDECDWESLYDDSGECLVPGLLEELTNSIGRVKVTSADSDYRPYQSIEERTNDGECVIEIYDFPAEFKTTDLFNVFAAYRSKNFQIKWVDDTHALGIFPSPLMADEVLACTLPFVKTRPLRHGIAESRTKARNLVLPPLPSMERPKTCTALARRLVTGALGLRIPTSSQEREKEKQVLKEAREKRRLEAKQREAAWEGTITSGSAI